MLWNTEESNSEQVQGSEAWLQWRSRHIGASEVPAIMGTCDFRTAYQCWLEKTGLYKKNISNFATERGKFYEPVILKEYQDTTGKLCKPQVLEFDIWPILSASLDGLTDCGIVVEVKCPSKAKHQLALAGYVPETYRDQVQTQMMVAGASLAHYVSYAPNEPDGVRLAIVEVKPDIDRQVMIVEKCKAFWEQVQKGEPPEGTSFQPELKEDLDELNQIKIEVKNLEARKAMIEDRLKGLMKANHVVCGHQVLTWSERKGSVDYSKIEVLKGLDLDQYRKPATKVFSVREGKVVE